MYIRAQNLYGSGTVWPIDNRPFVRGDAFPNTCGYTVRPYYRTPQSAHGPIWNYKVQLANGEYKLAMRYITDYANTSTSTVQTQYKHVSEETYKLVLTTVPPTSSWAWYVM